MSAWPWFSGTRRDQELDDEIQAHLEMAARDRIERGEAPESAALNVRREFGNRTLITESTREIWAWSWFEVLSQDVRYGLRIMRRSPGVTAVAVLSLALGIGANTAIFSLINALMLRLLPVRDPAQLVELLNTGYPGDPRNNSFGWKYYEHFRDQNHVFADLIASASSRSLVSSGGGEPEAVAAEYVVGAFFPALGVRPAIGRMLGPEDDRTDSAQAAVVVVSWPYWKSRFNLDPAVLGRQITVDGVPATVIGVAARDFSGLQVGIRTDLWLPMALGIARAGNAGRQPTVRLVGRLTPGVTIEQARAELRVLDERRIEETANATRDPLWRQIKIDVVPAAAGLSALRDQFAKPLLVLMTVVGVLLLIASANIASVLLARGAARRQEMALRVSLGAGRLRLVRQVLTESLLLAGAGAVLGVLLAYFGADALVRIMASGRPMVGWPDRLEIHVEPDVRVLLFTAAVAMLTGVLFGLVPAWHAFASAPMSSLREIGCAGETKSRRLFGKGLVVAQVALSVVLLSGAGMFAGHLANLRSAGLGFQRDSVLVVTLDPARSGYERLQLSHLYQELLGRLQTIRGVRSVSLSGTTPIQGGAASRFVKVEGFEEPPEARRRVMLNWVGPRYFETLGTPLMAGREFAFADEGRPGVAIVNQAMARHYFGGANPIGKYVAFEGQDRPYEIVGLVGDAKYASLHEAAPRTMYLNTFQEGRGASHQLVLRTNGAPTAVVADMRRVIHDALKTVRIAKVTTLADQMDASIVPERLIATLSGFFGGLGALLAAIGLYGLLAYTVTRRTNEIGIRMALGATQRDVARMVLNGALGLLCAGLLIGAPIALWTRRVAASMVENLPAATTLPIVFAAAAMLVVALVAAYLPARRAARVQPMDALRHS